MENHELGFTHVSVLLAEALQFLNLAPGKVWVDATLGGGGHLKAIYDAVAGSGTFVGLDRDRQAIDSYTGNMADNVHLIQSNYKDIELVLQERGIGSVTGGILADLGVSSPQLDIADRGFSFLKEGPLDMRMDQSQSLTAFDVVNEYSEKDLAEIIFKYGEERFSRSIARKIVKERPIKTTQELAAVVARSLRPSKRDQSHPATRTFQAIRIEVNKELDSLSAFLESGLKVLAPGARFVIITFHSLEDRLVKHFFKQAATSCHCPPRQPICTCQGRAELLVITRKPIQADKKEVLANPRARSAKLRAGEKL